jgi:hypothetical protein
MWQAWKTGENAHEILTGKPKKKRERFKGLGLEGGILLQLALNGVRNRDQWRCL